MDAEDLLNGLEGLRSVIPGFLQGAYDDLVNAIRQIYQGVTRSIAPTTPIDSGRAHLTTHAATLDTLHSQLSSNLLTFQTSYQGKGSDAYHTTAALALQHLGTLRDHTNFAIQKHQSISTNLENAQGSQMMLDGVVIALGFTLGSMIVTGGTDSEIAIPAAGGEAAGGAVTAGSLETSMELVGTDLTDLATETLPEAPDLGDITNLPDILDPDIDPDPDPDPEPTPDPWEDPPPPLPPLPPPDDRDDCLARIAEVQAAGYSQVKAYLIHYLVCLDPRMSPAEVINLFNTWTSMGMTQDDINNFLTKMIHLNITGNQLRREQIITFLTNHTTDIPGIWSDYKQVSGIQNVDQLLRDMANGNPYDYKGSRYGLSWLVNHKNTVQEVEPPAPGHPGEKGADFILKNGTIVDLKSRNAGNSTKLGAEIAEQIARYRTLYPNHPIEYVFDSSGGSVPRNVASMLQATSPADVSVGIARNYMADTLHIPRSSVTPAQIAQGQQEIYDAISNNGTGTAPVSWSTWP